MEKVDEHVEGELILLGFFVHSELSSLYIIVGSGVAFKYWPRLNWPKVVLELC